MDLIELAERVFPRTAAVTASITPSQYQDSTPCSEWNVHALLNHVVSTHHMFAALLNDEAPAEPVDAVGDDPGTAYANASKLSLEAFRQPGALDKTLQLPPGPMPGSVALGMLIMDNIVHGWDLAKGTGQPFTIDDAVATSYLEQMKQLPLSRRPAPGATFGPEVQVPDSAAPGDKLLAFLGRRP